MEPNEPVVVAEYSPQWPDVFEAEARELRAAFAPEAIAIEHIGSTSVPGLAAKPIVDMLLGAQSLAVIERRIPALQAMGYLYVPEYETVLPQRRYFVKPGQAPARFHLHAVERGGAFWHEQRRFLDALLREPALREEYVSLKRRLAGAYPEDRHAYTDAKAPFIQGVLGKPMPYQMTIVERPSYLHAAASGDYTAQNVSRFLREAYEACVERGKSDLLLEMRFAEGSIELGGIFGVIGERAADGTRLRKIAYVDESERDPEKMRFAETVAVNRGVNVRLFRDLEDAKRWMAQDDADRR